MLLLCSNLQLSHELLTSLTQTHRKEEEKVLNMKLDWWILLLISHCIRAYSNCILLGINLDLSHWKATFCKVGIEADWNLMMYSDNNCLQNKFCEEDCCIK